MDFDVVVIGAGAAGMMCAATAGARGRRVLLIEHAPIIGEKIRISGGGRCNFTNLHCTPANFLSRNPEFCRSALARYTPAHFVEMVDRHGIAWHEKKLGQLFCDGPSQQIIAMLRAECDDARVEWLTPCSVQGIERNDSGYSLQTGRVLVAARSLVIATGGLSVPKIGATPFGYKVAGQFGVDVVPPRPALVPLSLDPLMLSALGDLSGVAVDAEVSCNGGRFRENVLFTHRGLSGPAILQISSYWEGGQTITIDLLPGVDTAAWLSDAQRSSRNMLPLTLLADVLPRRLAQRWCVMHGLTQPLGAMSAKALRQMADRLSHCQIKPSGTLGYNKAEVTIGGVDTAYLSSKTMEAKEVPRLYFVGEVVDVTGHLGGFNFQWAWASGHAAGEAA